MEFLPPQNPQISFSLHCKGNVRVWFPFRRRSASRLHRRCCIRSRDSEPAWVTRNLRACQSRSWVRLVRAHHTRPCCDSCTTVTISTFSPIWLSPDKQQEKGISTQSSSGTWLLYLQLSPCFVHFCVTPADCDILSHTRQNELALFWP